MCAILMPVDGAQLTLSEIFLRDFSGGIGSTIPATLSTVQRTGANAATGMHFVIIIPPKFECYN